jgi:hypothetical protein
MRSAPGGEYGVPLEAPVGARERGVLEEDGRQLGVSGPVDGKEAEALVKTCCQEDLPSRMEGHGADDGAGRLVVVGVTEAEDVELAGG